MNKILKKKSITFDPGHDSDSPPQDSPDDESEDDEDDVESIMLEHTHEWWNLWALFRRVFRSHRFKVSSLQAHPPYSSAIIIVIIRHHHNLHHYHHHHHNLTSLSSPSS